MRDFKGMKRQRGRNRKPGGGNANAANPNRSWDSQGPENIKVRGNAQTVYERYQQLARDASSAGDRVLAENYLQHAEHYFRVLRALQPQRPVSEIAARELSNQGYDIDFEDETGAQAAAFLAAQQAADRENRPQNDGHNDQPREPREWRDRDQNRDGNQNRDRDQNRDQIRDGQPRDGQPRDRDAEPRAEGDGQGGRRETRRERWERRREERNRRFQAEGGIGDAPEERYQGDGHDAGEVPETPVAAEPAVEAPVREERPARRTRTPRAESRDEAPADDSDGSALPGFLTRPTAPSVAATETGEVPAAKKRAPRRKVEAAED